MVDGTAKYDFKIVDGVRGDYKLMGKSADDFVIDQLKDQLDRMIKDRYCMVNLGEPEPSSYSQMSLVNACGFISAYEEKEDGIYATFSLLPNENGIMAKDLIDKLGGHSFGLSSRGYGRVVYEDVVWWKRAIRFIGKIFGRNWYPKKKRIVDGFSLIGYDLITPSF